MRVKKVFLLHAPFLYIVVESVPFGLHLGDTLHGERCSWIVWGYEWIGREVKQHSLRLRRAPGADGAPKDGDILFWDPACVHLEK